MTAREKTAPAQVPARRDLSDLLLSPWPFGEGFPAAWRDLMGIAGSPIRIEEYVDGSEIVVRAELPGVDPDKDVEIDVDAGALTIRAERRENEEKQTAQGYRSEFRYGSMVRRVMLPAGTTADMVKATYRDGVLEVRFPAPDSSGTTKVSVVRE